MQNLFSMLIIVMSVLKTEWVLPSSTKIDTKLIPKKEDYLNFLDNPELKDYFFPTEWRPGKCPFKSNGHDMLIRQLKELAQALRNSRCDSRVQNLVSNLNYMAVIIRNTSIIQRSIHAGGLMYQVSDNVQPGNSLTNRPLNSNSLKTPHLDDLHTEYSMYVENAQEHSKELLKQITAATSDPQCVEDIHNSGVVSVIADMAVNLGQAALFVPGPNGLILGGAVLGLATSLKVVSALLKSPYDWNKEKDRMHFLSLNCNFFDLRKELDAADFFESRDDEKKEEKARRGKEFIGSFDKKLTELSHAKKVFHKNIIDAQNEFLKEKVDIKKVDIYRLLLEAETISLLDVDTRPEARVVLVKDIAKISIKLLPLLEEEKKEPYPDYMIKILKEFKEKTAELNAEKLKKFKTNHLLPLRVYLKEMRENLDELIRLELYEFEKIKVSDQESNSDVVRRGEKLFESIYKKLVDKKNQMVRRIALYEEKTRKQIFSPFDNGSHIDFDLLKEYHDTQDLILGSKGWGFLKYLTKSSHGDIGAFKELYESWESKYQGKKLDELSKGWACRDANQLRVKWSAAFSAVGVAYDFYETNKGLLQSHYDKFHKLFYLIPYRKTHYFKIHQNLVSLEKAKLAIESQSRAMEKEVNKINVGRFPTLGYLALRVNELIADKNKVDLFFKDKECLKYL